MSKPTNIRIAQKESQFFREISQLFTQTAADDSRLKDLFITRVGLSADKSVCFIYFYSYLGEEKFNADLDILILYKPSLRKALANSLNARYTPELIFKFDQQFKKQEKIENLLAKVKDELNNLD